MKTLYIDCSMGAAGDMIMGSLFELIDDKNEFIDLMNHIMPDGITVRAEKQNKSGIMGTHMKVCIYGKEELDIDDKHVHRKLDDIDWIIDNLNVSEKVKGDAKEIYRIIADAEAEVHGRQVNNIHFHEVGTMDAICDIVGNCLLMEILNVEKVAASPVQVGSGTVKCAHGILPVPAPATALILKNIPSCGGEIKGELCTPTGAAILRYFVDEFMTMPNMKIKKVGYGIGTKEFEGSSNSLRSILGESVDNESSVDYVTELVANIDDMTGEDIAYAANIMMEKGALDVYLEQIIMKKSRPAVKFVCICRNADKEKFIPLILKHTSTLGIREYTCKRYIMKRELETMETEYGSVQIKNATGFGIKKTKLEYNDISEIAKAKNQSLMELRKILRQD